MMRALLTCMAECACFLLYMTYALGSTGRFVYDALIGIKPCGLALVLFCSDVSSHMRTATLCKSFLGLAMAVSMHHDIHMPTLLSCRIVSGLSVYALTENHFLSFLAILYPSFGLQASEENLH